MNTRTKKITIIGMLCAVSYVVMLVGRLPITSLSFLKYDPKDVIIVIGGFIFGPVTACLISLIVSVLEMFTVSDTGFIGLLMNVLSTCSFAGIAAYIYKKQHSMTGAIVGLISGTLLMTVLMLMWNYFVTPIYMGYPREAVAEMLLPVFLPFNLIKGGLNAAFTVLLYKPVVSALRKARLVEPGTAAQGRTKAGVVIAALVLLATCVLLILVLRGIL